MKDDWAGLGVYLVTVTGATAVTIVLANAELWLLRTLGLIAP